MADNESPNDPPPEPAGRMRAALLTGLLFLPGGCCGVTGLFAAEPFLFYFMAFLFAWLPVLLLVVRWCFPPLECARCKKAVTNRGGAIPVWFDADTVDYRCDACKVTLCGVCATSTPTYTESLQSLKAKYECGGAALKRAIDADPRALYEKGELDPICPTCGDYLRKTGRVL